MSEPQSEKRPTRDRKRPAKIADDDGDIPGAPRRTLLAAPSPVPVVARARARRRPSSSTIASPPSSSSSMSGTEDPGPSRPPRPQTRRKRKEASTTKARSKKTKVGRAVAFNEQELQMVVQNAADRDQHAKDVVNGLSEEQAKDLLIRLVSDQPGLIIEIMEFNTAPPLPPQAPGPAPGPPAAQPHWCRCGNCRAMPLGIEEVCCRQQPVACISRTPEMQALCLDRQVLNLSMLYRADVLAIRNIGLADVRLKNRSFRFAAYRQHTLWQHGRLGRGVRRVIPSCSIWKIRDTYPDPSGQYISFRVGRR